MDLSNYLNPEIIVPEIIESGPLCITDLFQNATIFKKKNIYIFGHENIKKLTSKVAYL
jgi:hypothetical protein